jgi:agmatinase
MRRASEMPWISGMAQIGARGAGSARQGEVDDALDAPIAPGVLAPGFGGITYYEAFDLLRGIARKGKIAGYDVVEIAPAHDVANLTSQVCVRLTLNLMGAMAHAGQIGRAR